MDQDKTCAEGTVTAEGFIRHHTHMGTLCPVMLKTSFRQSKCKESNRPYRVKNGMVTEYVENRYPIPKKAEDGRHYFALPGGGHIKARAVIEPIWSA